MYATNAGWLWWNATHDAANDATNDATTNAVSYVSFNLQQEMHGYLSACMLHKVSRKDGKR
jgi:hypothetical protein